MTRIFKYKLEMVTKQTISMPVDAVVLCAQMQCSELYIWAIVDENESCIDWEFLIFGTGDEFNFNNMRYIGTVQQGIYVWHIFNLLKTNSP